LTPIGAPLTDIIIVIRNSIPFSSGRCMSRNFWDLMEILSVSIRLIWSITRIMNLIAPTIAIVEENTINIDSHKKFLFYFNKINKNPSILPSQTILQFLLLVICMKIRE
jgi:hypothetical protein